MRKDFDSLDSTNETSRGGLARRAESLGRWVVVQMLEKCALYAVVGFLNCNQEDMG